MRFLKLLLLSQKNNFLYLQKVVEEPAKFASRSLPKSKFSSFMNYEDGLQVNEIALKQSSSAMKKFAPNMNKVHPKEADACRFVIRIFFWLCSIHSTTQVN